MKKEEEGMEWIEFVIREDWVLRKLRNLCHST
jgi:hypothetical protein